jgi:hypothetical protein
MRGLPEVSPSFYREPHLELLQPSEFVQRLRVMNQSLVTWRGLRQSLLRPAS